MSLENYVVFEVGCGITKIECIDTWSTWGIGPGIKISDNSLLLKICRHIFWNVIDGNAKVELQLSACYGGSPEYEPPVYSNGDEL